MKKLLLILLSVLSLTVFAQTEPNWYDNDMRRAFYPPGQYFVGYAEGQRMGSESVGVATERLKNAARVEAVSTIRVHVKNTTVNQALSQTLRTMEGTFRQSAREFSSATQTTVDMEIPGLQIESWRNPQTGEIAAFAYVKKSTLIRQLEKKITVGLTKIETAMDQIDQLVANGQKLQARDLAEKTVPLFLEKAIEGELSKMGVTFVSNAAQSDWAIYVDAPAREYRKNELGGTSSYFSYVDAGIIIDKTTTGQRIYEDQITEKGGHTMNFEQAARDAYKNIAPKISEIIKNQIQQ